MRIAKDVFIEKISLKEVYKIHQLASIIWPQAFEHILSKEQIAYMMHQMYSIDTLTAEHERGVWFYILYYKKEPMGYTALEVYKQDAFKLHKIYLSQKLRGKGYGKILLEIMEMIARANGAAYLYLNVNRQNTALTFYKSQGYEILKEEDIDIGQGYFMNDYSMYKQLVTPEAFGIN